MAELSIIIPTLNEANYITNCLRSIKENAIDLHRLEILVIDSGSSDETISLIDPDCKVFHHPELKGSKYRTLNQGAFYAQGKILLFLDADTLVPPGFDQLIFDAVADKKTVGGAFEFAFIEKHPLLKAIQLTNRFRYRVRQSYYGDQGVFVKSSALKKVGGFPPVKIMETALLCRKLKSTGRLKLIRKPSKTSARRFIRGGILKVYLFDMVIWLRAIFGLPIQHHAPDYWKENEISFN